MSVDVSKLSLAQIAELGKKCKAITDAATSVTPPPKKDKKQETSHKKTVPESTVKHQAAPPCATVIADANSIKKTKKKDDHK